MELRCPNCREAVSAADRFCVTCGTPLAVPVAPLPPPLSPEPPPPAPPGPPPPSGKRDRSWLPAALAVVVLVGGVGGWIAIQGSKNPLTFPPNEVYLEPVGVVEHAFTPNLLASISTPEAPGPPSTLTLADAAEVAHVKGSDELNYGSARGISVCDTDILRRHLTGEPAVSQAWAEVQGIEPEEVMDFVAGLTSMILTQDVRVTTHVLDEGSPVPRQAILQQGMAVLVAATGEPRVRCESGSPLSLPVAVVTPTYVGVAWPGFDPAAVVQIEPCDEPLTRFVLQDTATGEPFVRPIGSDVTGDSDAILTAEGELTTSTTIPTTTTVATTTTAATTTSTTTTTLPVANHDATGEGTVTASSRLCGSYAAAKSVDGDVTTSWISSSGDGPFSTFEWTGTRDEFIGAVAIVSNADHATVRRRTDHGFAAVTIQIIDDSDEIIYEERVELPGTPDPNVLVEPDVIGRSVRILLEGHENPSGSGFSELTVMVAR